MAAKFFKSLFSSSDKGKKQKNDLGNEAEDRFSTDPKRKLSISRSGRMKQQLKKRGSLNNDLFGEEEQKIFDNPAIEYHVHRTNINKTILADNNNSDKDFKVDLNKDHDKRETKLKSKSKSMNQLEEDVGMTTTDNSITPEVANLEIEKAFEIVESAM